MSVAPQKVFGIGLSRTGGASLGAALVRLGLRTVHFPADPATRREIIRYLDQGAAGPLELTVLGDLDAVSDTPICCVYEGLDEAYPDAKFILTVRDEASWLRSCEAYWGDPERHPKGRRLGAGRSRFDRGLRALITGPLRRRLGRSIDHSAYTAAIEKHLYGSSDFAAERFAAVRRSHEQAVRERFADRPDKLLVLDICSGEGWERLCPFLGVDTPTEPFPWHNSRVARPRPAGSHVSAAEWSPRVLMLAEGAIHGGHLMQAQKTAEFLRLSGVDVTVANAAGADVSGYDIVHAFGSPLHIRDVLREARRRGARVVVSPIYWEYGAAQGLAGRLLRSPNRAARLTVSSVRRGIDATAARVRGRAEEAAMLLELADLLLPNSESEALRIRSTLDVTTPMHVVYNGFDPRTFSSPETPVERQGIVCVARLEPHKNQLGLIKALRGVAVPLTLVGEEHPHHPGYAERCRAAAGPNVEFRSVLTQEELAELFRTAKVHVLPSWFETTGLVSLEAAACGCAVVTTSRGDTREYFGDLAVYCDPAQRRSIRTAVEEALEAGATPGLAEHVRERFSWEATADATLAAYLTLAR